MRFYFIVLMCLSINLSEAQVLHPGIEGGLNLTIANPSNVYGGYGDKKPFIGGLLGVSLRYKYSDLCFLKPALYFENRTVLGGPEIITDNNANFLTFQENNRISNNYLNFKIENHFKLTKVISIGMGINNHFLLWSATHFPGGFVIDQGNIPAPKKYSNHFYKRYWLSIPLTINFDFNKCSIFLTYDKGISSRLTSKSFFKERENCLQLGFGYRFGKKE